MQIAPELLKPLAEVRLASAPVAVAFLATPPPGLERIGRPDPASCGYWKQASEGHAFYTTADDHGNCAVGAFTHGVALSPAQGQDLQALVGTMVELKYLKSDEVPMIPHRTEPLTVAAYAPLSEATFDPDLVVFRGNVRQIMLLSEAARAAGVFEATAVMGRPACAMLPHTITTGGAVASVGCIGNRVYTGLGDDELYLTLPGGSVTTVLENLAATLNANAELETFHRQRAAQLSWFPAPGAP
jgi:uncharacterized protein (DUF169 family)